MRHSEVRAQVDIEDQEPPVEELADDAVVCADGASTWCSWIDEFWTAATSAPPELVTLVPKNVLDGRYA